ncbi:hypothetical protein ACFQI7_27370 [Paenibacillus allorhizosphaerae]|uniref:Uncharacterized protein n=1 Tax=Paenibacillus allorhizosphaerae TaxID=2849866 RepID=A0ABM8VNF8_9BACL|nr:hypothetical protein [Paenibacillus allorhizosphaerae]CAG7651383.1 hypothetical protein PAECIP111802_04949 [Paenibacillus allorhizosphaerae]
MMEVSTTMETERKLPAEVQELCNKLNMKPEETISHALSLLNVSLQLQEQGYQIQACRNNGFWRREVRNIFLRGR